MQEVALVDTHCHLTDPRFDGDRRGVVERARAAGVVGIVVIADSLASSTAARDLARTCGLASTAGVHPHHAEDWTADAAARIAELLDDPLVVAVGETGLDYHYDHAPRAVQRRAFAAQLQLAAERGKAVVVHARDADEDVAQMLSGLSGTVVLHSFSGGAALFEAGLAADAYFSFSGMVTFRNWAGTDHLRSCPEDRLLIETDAPYLAPHPHRGKRNEPAFVRLVAERIAALRDIPFAAAAELTTRNAERCFRWAFREHTSNVP